jgi:hypothetical protein
MDGGDVNNLLIETRVSTRASYASSKRSGWWSSVADISVSPSFKFELQVVHRNHNPILLN